MLVNTKMPKNKCPAQMDCIKQKFEIVSNGFQKHINDPSDDNYNEFLHFMRKCFKCEGRVFLSPIDSNEDHNMAEECQHYGEHDEGDPDYDGIPSSALCNEECLKKLLNELCEDSFENHECCLYLVLISDDKENIIIYQFCT